MSTDAQPVPAIASDSELETLRFVLQSHRRTGNLVVGLCCRELDLLISLASELEKERRVTLSLSKESRLVLTLLNEARQQRDRIQHAHDKTAEELAVVRAKLATREQQVWSLVNAGLQCADFADEVRGWEAGKGARSADAFRALSRSIDIQRPKFV